MKRPFPFLKAGLIVASLCLASVGCSQTGSKETSSKSKPGDPTAWADREVSSESSSGSSSKLPQTSRLTGGWSSDAREIEKSLGVGN